MPGILLREEALRHETVEPDRETDGGERDPEHDDLMAQTPTAVRCRKSASIHVETRARSRGEIRPGGPQSFSRFRKREQSIGVSVSEMTPETRMAALR